MRIPAPSVLLALAVACAALGCNLQPEAELAVFGDSVTWGFGDLPGGWVRRLETKSGYTVSNLGVPGERADGAAGRIDAALRSVPKARVVFILHGGNDWVKAFRSSHCDRQCDPAVVDGKYEAIGRYLRSIRRAVARRGKKPVFITYWPSSPAKCPKYTAEVFAAYHRHRLRLNDEIVEVASEHGDHVIRTDDLQDFGAENDFYDCLHPSPQGYERIASRILDDLSAWEPGEPDWRDALTPRF